MNIPYGKRIFVTEIRPETNEVVVGSPEDVFTDTLVADHVNYMGLTDFDGRRLLGKTVMDMQEPCVPWKISERAGSAVILKNRSVL